MKKNSKGFTLIELLAVIVVLAIIMVIATTQVNKAMAGARKDSFVQSAKMVVRETKNRLVAGSVGGSSDYNICTGNCTTTYDLSEKDYYLDIKPETNGNYIITLYSIKGGKFASVKNLDSCDMTNVICSSVTTETAIEGSTSIKAFGPKMVAKLDASGNIVE